MPDRIEADRAQPEGLAHGGLDLADPTSHAAISGGLTHGDHDRTGLDVDVEIFHTLNGAELLLNTVDTERARQSANSQSVVLRFLESGCCGHQHQPQDQPGSS